MPDTGIIFDIQRFSIHDGPGIRSVVFLKGCPLRCAWCANPESQRAQPEVADFAGACIGCGDCLTACPRHAIRDATGDGGRYRPFSIDRSRCDDCGRCADVCMPEAKRWIGRRVTVDEVMAEVRKDAAFYRSSTGGVTLSGGEPLAQLEFSLAILDACRRSGIRTAVESCGHARLEDIRQVAELADLFLYDLKQLDSVRHRKLTGQGNELILRNLERLLELGAVVTVRMPVVPGANDDRESLAALADFVARHPGIRGVELLPYHPLGRHKYEALGAAWPEIETPDPAGLASMAAFVAGLAPGVDCSVTQGFS